MQEFNVQINKEITKVVNVNSSVPYNVLQSEIVNLTGQFYPLNSNPSNYITSSQTGVFITTGQTGSFGGTFNTGPLVGTFAQLNSGNTFSSTNTFSSSVACSNFIPKENNTININSNIVAINNTNPLYTLDVNGSGNFNSGLFVNDNPVITSSQTGIFITNNQTGQFVTTGQTGNFNIFNTGSIIANTGIIINSSGNQLTIGTYFNNQFISGLPALNSNSTGIGMLMPLANTYYNAISGNVGPGTWITFACATISNVNGRVVATAKLWSGQGAFFAGEDTEIDTSTIITGYSIITLNGIINLTASSTPIVLSCANTVANANIMSFPGDNFGINGGATGVATYINMVRLY